MTDTLGDLLRRSADAVTEPRIDVGELVARAESRQRRRRVAVATTTAGLVAAVVVGVVAVRGGQPQELEPAPSPSPSPSPPSSVAVDTTATRPLVYAEGSTVHVGDRTVEAQEPVAFVDATDDGAVFEAALDCTLWFTDGTTTTRIGSSPWTAAPTAHPGSVVTGDSGSLVVWRDVTSCKDQAAERYVVYDTSRREVVAHIPFSTGDDPVLVYVDEDEVYFTPQSRPGCWLYDSDIHPCSRPHLIRFDVGSNQSTRIALDELDAALAGQPRMFVHPTSAILPGYTAGALFAPDGRRLVHVDDGMATVLTRTNGDEVRLRLPAGWTDPQPDPETSGGGIAVSQWLDDDTVTLWADDGGGDLPVRNGDLLVCRMPNGVCRVEIARGSRAGYVLPARLSG